ncbi:purine-cytosine permease family protein [Neorhodopirellula lusitana]|uniref:purine-cytosine permease family protein n=1 Tax=Neorhodopirellula lusitana TaxID=445327 RepID=UPI00384C7F80
MSTESSVSAIANMKAEQLPIPDNKLHGWTHFLGLYAGEHVAATEFVIGATFVAMGATTMDILIGLLIGNFLAILSWTLITAPIAVQTRLSLYTYLHKIAGDSMTKLYNWANVLIFTVISAAMITVSSTAVRLLFNIPAQLDWYPNSVPFVAVVLAVGAIVVFVAMYGFNAVAEFSSICGPWLVVMFTSGALVLFPALAESVLGRTQLLGFADFITIGDQSIWTGINSNGEPGIGLLEVIGFAWAANTITHFGLIDMALLRYAKKSIYGLCSSAGMLFGHYVAWIAAGIMGAGTAVLLKSNIAELDPGDVAYQALGLSGYVIVIVAGWTTANANLYRAGLAAQAIFHNHSRQKVTLTVGCITVVIACFPFVFSQMLPLLTYAGLIVVPVGGIVFAEHVVFPRIGFTRYWLTYRKMNHSTPAVASWIAGLIFGFGLNAMNVMSFFYLFLPTWLFTIVCYTLLAKSYGAAEKYPVEEEKERELNVAIKEYQAKQALSEGEHVQDISNFTKTLQVLAWSSLTLTLVLALNVMFRSPDLGTYDTNAAIFYTWGFVFTISYFATAYWVLRRKKALNLHCAD